MLTFETPVSRFLALYARETAEGNMPAVASHFADTFLFAGPSGAQPVRTIDFAAALPKRKALFDQLGSQPAKLTAVHETPLDSRYILARTRWRFCFAGTAPLRSSIPTPPSLSILGSPALPKPSSRFSSTSLTRTSCRSSEIAESSAAESPLGSTKIRNAVCANHLQDILVVSAYSNQTTTSASRPPNTVNARQTPANSRSAEPGRKSELVRFRPA